jgi:CDP-diacylglycerol--serine O-phosphatidyltransferase
MELQKIKHAGIITIPSLFTVGNICCGFFSILASISGNYTKAGWLVFAAMALDSFDGRVARMLKAESAFGVEMDSLADLISFCAAPAFMIYFMALKGSPVWGAPISFMFMLFGALRLAKFNVMAHEGKSSKQYFSGLPTPAAAAVLVSFAMSYNIFALDANGRLLPGMHIYLPYIYNGVAFLTVGLALLMVSSIPYAAFKSGAKPAAGRRKISALKFTGVAIVMALFFKYPQDIVFILFGSYALMGIIVMMFKAFRNIKEKN